MENNQSSLAKVSPSVKTMGDKPSDEGKKNIFAEMENEVLEFWKKNKIFEKSVAKEAPRGEYVFYDGPPFATGTPHYGHLVASLMKDVVPRFWTMNGYQVPRKWGWDCHGLPIENIVEKELGTKSKKEIIENIGVEKFNALCRSKVFSYTDEWEKIITRLGRWVDMEHPYRTMDIGYMESIWWAFKQLWDKGLVYKDYRSMHVCPRCETTLSQSEVAEGYKDVKDLSVTAKFELDAGQKIGDFITDDNTYILAWTTTPWTLPGNVALAVGNDVDYIQVQKLKKVENSEEFADTIIEYEFICSKKYLFDRTRAGGLNQRIGLDSNAGELIGWFEIKKEFKGGELVGKKYKPPFDYYINDEKLANRENGWQIYHGDFVTTEDGTGVVHIAPAFGEDDMALGRQYTLPFIQHVAMDGTFNKEMGDGFAGMHVKPIEDVQSTDVAIIKYLAAKGLLFSKEKFEHSYPHCWRCDTPLINYATSSWFVKISQMKPRMLELAEGIDWSPEHIKTGRFGKWLEGARDWSISRQRFWASCLPIWECSCGAKKVMGSLEEFYQAADGALTKIILVRHGEAENNVANIISNSTTKYSLTEKGQRQIKEAAEKIKAELSGKKNEVVVFASPVLRAQESAKIISQELGIDFATATSIKEMAFGAWEDCNEDELSASDELRKKYDGLPDLEKMDTKRGGGGESSFEVGARVYAWLEEILPVNAGKTIIIISHADPIIDLINELKSRDKKESAIAWTSSEYPEKGSVKIIYVNNATKKEIDLHKDSIDKINLKCDICGGKMKRVNDVLDTWFDSGSMPYAQMHYPFENKERFENNFPAEFIAEGIDQTRCWFYYLHAISTGIKNNFAYKNVIVNGIVLAEDGKKMSKKLKNYPDPSSIFDKYGADALRYYLLTSPVMLAENLNFSEKAVGDCLRKVNMILWNVYKFYEMYCHSERSISGVGEPLKADFEPKNILDKWIIARLNQLVAEVTEGMKKYDLPSATRPIVQFIDDFSTWYIRRSRDRFKGEEKSSQNRHEKPLAGQGALSAVEADKLAALATTGLVLIDLAKIMAPFTPFIAEQLWQKVTGNNFANPEMSVHLEEWPNSSLPRRRESSLDTAEVKILEKMMVVRKIVELGLAKRDEVGIKVRQPLAKAIINGYDLDDNLTILIKDELNVKEIIYSGKILTEISVTKVNENDKSLIEEVGDVKRLIDNKNIVELDIAMTPELIAEGMKRELVRFINAERKNSDLTIADRIALQISTESEAVKNAVKLFEIDLKKDVLADEIIIGAIDGGREVDVNGEKAIIKVIKR